MPAHRLDDAAAMDPVFEERLVEACTSFDFVPSAEQIARMWQHFAMLRKANEKFNLTRITDPARAAVEHYADSLTLLPWLAERRVVPRRALDLGTGAGFPAVPLAIVLPDVQWTAIDSTGKKARFVAHAAAALGLSNLCARHVRARELAGKVRPFDLVVCRAVAKLPGLIRETASLLGPGSFLVAYKTEAMAAEERIGGERAARTARLAPQPDFPTTIAVAGETYRRRLVSYRNDER